MCRNGRTGKYMNGGKRQRRKEEMEKEKRKENKGTRMRG